MFLHVSVILFTGGWYPNMHCRWYPSMPCSRSPGGYLSMPCRFPGPHPGGSWGIWPGGVFRPTPKGELRGLAWGVSRPTPRGVYPSMHWSRPPWWLLLQAVCILLESILVPKFILDNLTILGWLIWTSSGYMIFQMGWSLNYFFNQFFPKYFIQINMGPCPVLVL